MVLSDTVARKGKKRDRPGHLFQGRYKAILVERTIFDRYNIVNDKDLRLATQSQETYLQAQMGTITGTMGKSGETVRSTGQAQVVDFIGGAREGTRTPTGNPTGS